MQTEQDLEKLVRTYTPALLRYCTASWAVSMTPRTPCSKPLSRPGSAATP